VNKGSARSDSVLSEASFNRIVEEDDQSSDDEPKEEIKEYQKPLDQDSRENL